MKSHITSVLIPITIGFFITSSVAHAAYPTSSNGAPLPQSNPVGTTSVNPQDSTASFAPVANPHPGELNREVNRPTWNGIEKADLQIVLPENALTYRDNTTARIFYFVKNNSTTTAHVNRAAHERFQTTLEWLNNNNTVLGTYVASSSVASMAPGHQCGNVLLKTIPAGATKIRLTVDKHNYVDEQDESNNVVEITLPPRPVTANVDVQTTQPPVQNPYSVTIPRTPAPTQTPSAINNH